MTQIIFLVVFTVIVACITTSAFQPSSVLRFPPIKRSVELTATRRGVMDGTISTMATMAVAMASFLVVSPKETLASGGATAGGAYLLSAKQRYNNRVTKGSASFTGLKGALEKGDVDTVRSYFSSEEEGSWKDFTAAGYLLANAYRTNSSAAPDSLPSVKKWKAFTGQVEVMTKALKKKDIATALLAHEEAVVALNEYLAKVDLQ